MPLRPAFASALVLACSAGALAQSTEYKLGDQGWVQTAAPAPGTDEAVIQQARVALAEDRPGEAKATLDAWLGENERSESPLLPQAYLLRGDATTALGNEYTALYDYERVIKEFPGDPSYITAVERELDIAVRYVHGMNRKFMGVRWIDATDVGEELLIRVQERLPGSRLAERAGIELADYYYRNRDLRMAAEAYELFMENFPNSQYRMKAMQRRVYATIGRFKGPRYDGSTLIDAKILVQRFAALYPSQAQAAGLDEALLVRLDESSAQALLEAASWYIRRGDEPAGRYTLRRLIRQHPQTAAAAEALRTMESRGWPLPAPPPPPPEGDDAEDPAEPGEAAEPSTPADAPSDPAEEEQP